MTLGRSWGMPTMMVCACASSRQGSGRLLSSCSLCFCPLQSYQNQQASVAGVAGGQQEEEDSSDSEAADFPSSDERRIVESPPHRY